MKKVIIILLVLIVGVFFFYYYNRLRNVKSIKLQLDEIKFSGIIIESKGFKIKERVKITLIYSITNPSGQEITLNIKKAYLSCDLIPLGEYDINKLVKIKKGSTFSFFNITIALNEQESREIAIKYFNGVIFKKTSVLKVHLTVELPVSLVGGLATIEVLDIYSTKTFP